MRWRPAMAIFITSLHELTGGESSFRSYSRSALPFAARRGHFAGAKGFKAFVFLGAVLIPFLSVIIDFARCWRPEFEIGFIQHVRSRTTRRLAAAQCDVVSHLRHSRIGHLMGADIQKLDSAIYLILRLRQPKKPAQLGIFAMWA